jgi:hypothetical protein
MTDYRVTPGGSPGRSSNRSKSIQEAEGQYAHHKVGRLHK